jgi:hypothetical protein
VIRKKGGTGEFFFFSLSVILAPSYYNNWRIIMVDEELMKYSRELEEDLESDNIPSLPQGQEREEPS